MKQKNSRPREDGGSLPRLLPEESVVSTGFEGEEDGKGKDLDMPSANNDRWLQKILDHYPRMLLILIGLVFFNEGLILMKNLATKDLFKNYYHLEPSMAQKLAVLTVAPSLLKILTGFIVDAKLFKQRKHILMLSGTV